jgi:broad specificity phosphatase PhoE
MNNLMNIIIENTEKRNIIITTHSKRLRQFMSKYFKNFERKLRFKNCSIIHIYFEDKTRAKLLYSGEIDENEDRNDYMYYDIPKFNNLDIYSNKLIVPSNINIFLIRHAQGYHNANNTLFKKFMAKFDQSILKDPQLTQIGHLQARNSGIFLNKYFVKNNLSKSLSILFCSVLLRTRETLNIILDEMDINDKDIIILPLSNEITNFIMPEHLIINKHMCSKDPAQRVLYKCDSIKGKYNNRNINWDFYRDFRNKHIFNQNIDSNMIYQTYIIVAKLLNKSSDYVDELEMKLNE